MVDAKSQDIPIKFDKNGFLKGKVSFRKPPKYSIEVLHKFENHMRQGGSVLQFCRNELISKSQFYEWCKSHPELDAARVYGKEWAEAWWMSQALEHLVTETVKTVDEDGGYTQVSKKFDTNLYKFVTGGRFGHTSDKALLELLQLMQSRLEGMPQAKQQTALEPEYELEDNASRE